MHTTEFIRVLQGAGLATPEDVRLVNRLVSIIGDAGVFITGSSVYGPTSPQDIDVCVNGITDAVVSVLGLEKDKYTSDGCEYGSVRVLGTNINLVCLNRKRFETWKTATTIMRMLHKDAFATKAKRCGTFETLCGLVEALGLELGSGLDELEDDRDELLKFIRTCENCVTTTELINFVSNNASRLTRKFKNDIA